MLSPIAANSHAGRLEDTLEEMTKGKQQKTD
jgi:hypothetical protein